MGFKQPEGRIVVNTGVGSCDKVDPAEVSEYGLKGDDQIHHYNVDGQIVTINRFKKAVKDLRKIKY